MKLTRLAALVAVPAALSLAACGGGSSGVLGNNVGTGGQTANIRFVNGSPDLGSNIDIYFHGDRRVAPPSAPAAPSTTNMPYGQASFFVQEPTTAYTAVVRAAGASSGSAAARGARLPDPAARDQRQVHRRDRRQGGAHTCRLFQDFDYSDRRAVPRPRRGRRRLGSQIAYGTHDRRRSRRRTARRTSPASAATRRRPPRRSRSAAGRPDPEPDHDAGLRRRPEQRRHDTSPRPTRSTRRLCSRRAR